MGSNMDSKEFDLYKDIRCRTNGEIYIGVVGPVRTGKSTFIKHFMETMSMLKSVQSMNCRNQAKERLL
mgnify:CR=1 FL=1